MNDYFNSLQMTCQRKKQIDEFIDEINNDDLVQIKEYDGVPLNRYYFDKANKRVLFYMPIHRKYKLLKPSRMRRNDDKYKSIGLVSADNSKRMSKSWNKFIKTMIRMYCSIDDENGSRRNLRDRNE